MVIDEPNNLDRLTVTLATATGTDVKYLFRTVHAPTVPHIRMQTRKPTYAMLMSLSTPDNPSTGVITYIEVHRPNLPTIKILNGIDGPAQAYTLSDQPHPFKP